LEDVLPFGTEFDASKWKAITISSQSARIGDEPLIRWCSNVLASEGISLFYLSTYSTDHVLVQSENHDRAVTLLRESFSNRQQNKTSALPRSQFQGTEKKHLLILPEQTYLAFAPKSRLESEAFSLMKLLFYPRTEPERFIAFMDTEEGLSFLADDFSYSLIEKVVTKTDKTWKTIQLCDTTASPNSIPGIVSGLATPLCNLHGRILGVSSFSTDFILVGQDEIETAKHCLQTTFVILEE